MRRRELLGISLAGVAGCLELPLAKIPPMSPEEIERVLASLDRSLAAMRAHDAPKDVRDPDGRGRAAGVSLLSSLHVMGAYRAIPEEARSDPRVRERFERAAPDVARTIDAARAYLNEVDARAVDDKLRKDRSLPMRAFEQIDAIAAEAGVSLGERTWMRATVADLAGRMRLRGVKPVLGDVIAQHDRAVESAGPKVLRTRFPVAAPTTSFDVFEQACKVQGMARIGERTRPLHLVFRKSECGLEVEDALRVDVDAQVEMNELWVSVEVVSDDPATEGDVREALLTVAKRLQHDLDVSPPPRPNLDEGRCKADIDCHAQEECKVVAFDRYGRCVPSPRRFSDKLMVTAGRTALIGLITLVLCVGAVILLTALFMVIIAGLASAAGN